MISLNIQLALSTAYHLQTDGQTERMNQVVEDYLLHFCSYYQDNWDRLMYMAEFSIKYLDLASLGVSPFFSLAVITQDLIYQRKLLEEKISINLYLICS